MSNPAGPFFAKLGISHEDGKGTARVYSENATAIDLHILNPDNRSETTQVVSLARGENNIWSATSAFIQPGITYAFRADGPTGPRHKFKPTLNLIDPYARGIVRESARELYSVDITDEFDWQGVQKPNIPMSETIVYEAHPRGLTRANEDLPDDIRGTYAALGHPSTIAHLKNIGITAIELLPLHQIISEPRLLNMGLYNYWGYNTINFFTPHHRYASMAAQASGPQAVVNELKTAIRELHRAGIEVILDVVYNHTAEGGGGGLTYSYRGLDNSSYYRQDDLGNYHDTTGCGNSLNFANPHVLQLVMDSLRYWTNEMQIDGFRFDLMTTLARNEINHFDPNHPLLVAMSEDESLRDSKLIAEPWDVGLGGWQTGNFPDRFSEWNDRFRDSVRRFWLSDIASARTSGKHWNGVADLATRLAGSKDIIDGSAGPMGVINFVTAHDGFTLHDLVSYDVKHNQVNGESNRDGTNDNRSFNHGAEGDYADKKIRQVRYKAMRNLMATLLLSAGVPMIAAGDERAKSQLGNNNAYCQDNVISWVNWKLNEDQANFEQTFAFLTKLRRENRVLRPTSFGNFDAATPESDQIRWYNREGEIMPGDQWDDPEHRTLQRYSAHLEADGNLSAMLLVIHGSEAATEAALPTEIENAEYQLLWDSNLATPPSAQPSFAAGAKYKLAGTSMKIFRVNFLTTM